MFENTGKNGTVTPLSVSHWSPRTRFFVGAGDVVLTILRTEIKDLQLQQKISALGSSFVCQVPVSSSGSIFVCKDLPNNVINNFFTIKREVFMYKVLNILYIKEPIK